MKILELPQATIVRCDCGCKFKYDVDDIISDRLILGMGEIIMNRLSVVCPFCKDKILIKEIRHE